MINMKLNQIVRVLLSIIFLTTGIMKLTIPEFTNAFRIQLEEAQVPFRNFNEFFIPILELIIGSALIVRKKVNWALLLIMPIMVVAIYVHLVVTNPLAFPAQPQFPVMPIVVVAMTGYLIKNRNSNSR